MDELTGPQINPISGDCVCPSCPKGGSASGETGTSSTRSVQPIFPVPVTADTAPLKTGIALRALDQMAEALEWIERGETPDDNPLLCLLIHAALECAEWNVE